MDVKSLIKLDPGHAHSGPKLSDRKNGVSQNAKVRPFPGIEQFGLDTNAGKQKS
jgi:hypothetical protein